MVHVDTSGDVVWSSKKRQTQRCAIRTQQENAVASLCRLHLQLNVVSGGCSVNIAKQAGDQPGDDTIVV